ncbi:hypothetical protein SDC9_173055 [bioreactor metagenome]|uniref:Uncharacterized protein n=1 Tax=bioreactor metagenome TaxID=1076179 RepID=A0A645GPP0_9ZZZZ
MGDVGAVTGAGFGNGGHRAVQAGAVAGNDIEREQCGPRLDVVEALFVTMFRPPQGQADAA